MRDKFTNDITNFLFSIRSKLLSTSFGSMECAHNALKYIDSQMSGYNPEKIHVQLFVDEVNAFVDSRVAMTVKYLNRIEIKTCSSCEEIHDDEWGTVIQLNVFAAVQEKLQKLMEQTPGIEYKIYVGNGIASFFFTEINHLKPLRIVLDTFINQVEGITICPGDK